jgi:hypothetical protein
MKQRFVEGKGLFSLFRLSLFRTWKKSDLGNPLFRHLWTWSKWERYEYEEDEPNRIMAFAYRFIPYPSTSKLIDIAIESNNEDEIKGACRLLYELEFKGHEYRADLIYSLEQSIDQLTEKRFNIIYENANLINHGNLRDIMNKSDEAISSDLDEYQELYKRALSIKEKIKTATNIV